MQAAQLREIGTPLLGATDVEQGMAKAALVPAAFLECAKRICLLKN